MSGVDVGDRARLAHGHLRSAKSSLIGNETRARVWPSLDEHIVFTHHAVYKATTHCLKIIHSTMVFVCL